MPLPSAATGTMGRGFDPRVWLLALGTFAVGTDAFVISGILDQVSRDFAIDLDAAGNIVSVYSLTYALSAPILAALTARWRKDRLVIVALAVFTIANVLCAVAPSYGAILAARILAGVAAGLYTPTAYALAASLAAADRKGAALAAVAFGVTGSVVAGVPLGIIVGNRFGWHASFWLIAALSLVAFVAIGLRPPRVAQTVSPVIGLRARFAPLVDPKTLLALLPTALMSAGIGATYTYLGALLRVEGYGDNAVTSVFFTMGLGGLIGAQISGRTVDRLGANLQIALFLGVGVIDAGLVRPALPSFIGVAATCFMLNFVFWMVMIGQQRRLIRLTPAHPEFALALNNSFLYAGMAAGAALGGLIVSRLAGLDLVPIASCGLLVVAILVFAWSVALERRDAG